MADRRFALINKALNDEQVSGDLTVAGDWTFTGTLDVTSATFTGLSSDDLSDVASIAMLDEDETVTGNWTFDSTGIALTIESISPVFQLVDTNAPTDETRYRLVNNAGNFGIVARNDADGSGNTAFQIQRSGTTIDEVEINATTTDVNGDMDISGSLTFANGPVDSGTYTPTTVGVTNVDSTSGLASQWIRIGNTVAVSGRANIDPTSTGLTQIRISLPVAATFSANTDLAGTSAQGFSNADNGQLVADTSNNDADMRYQASETVNRQHTFVFIYTI